MAAGKKTGGRKAGVPNKRTREVEAAMEVVAAQFKRQVPEAFDGDGVAFLQTVYRNPGVAVEVRIDAAAKAARFERPTLSAVAVREMPKARPDLSALSPAEQAVFATMLRRVLPASRLPAGPRVEIEGVVA